MRRVAQRAFLGGDLAGLDRFDLGADGQKRRDEAVDLGFGLALGRLHHQRASHWPAHRRRVEAVVDQPLGDVVHRHARRREGPGVEDAFVRHPSPVAHEEDRILRLQPGRDVIGVQDRHAGRLGQPLAAHHHAIGPGDQQDRGRAPGRGRNRPLASSRVDMAGKVRREMRLDPDRPHARPAAAMRDGEGLVQVQVADVAADLSGLHQAHQRVHVGAVQIDLAAMLVGDLADLAHGLFEDAMGRGIGDHAGRQPVARLGRLRAEVIEVHVSVGRGLDDDHLHPGHLRRGRVRAMGRGRDQAQRPRRVPPRLVIGEDRHQPGIFPLCARIWLHGKGIVAGDLAQLVGQVGEDLVVACRLVDRRERMQVGEFRPGDRRHLGRGVQFHRAAPQGDHRPVQRQVAVREPAHVAHHLAFGPVHVEDRMGQEGRLPQQALGEGEFRPVRRRALDAEAAQHADQNLLVRRLVQRDAHTVAPDLAQVQPLGPCGGEDAGLAHADLDGDRVEEGGGFDPRPGGLQGARQTVGQEMHALADGAQALGPVEDRIHRGHDGQQSLRRADVGGRLLAPDVLLAGLQRQPVGLVATAVDRHADDPPRHLPLQGVLAGEEGGVRPAIAHRHAEALRGPQGDIRPHRPGLLQERQGQKIRRHAGDGALVMQPRDIPGQVADMAERPRILEERAEDRSRVEVLGRADDDLDPERLGPGLHHADGLGMAALVDEEGPRLRLGATLGHGHGLGRRRGLVQKRGIGHVHARQFRHHGLVVQQCLQPALGDLGLVGRIGGVPGGVLQDVALDRRGRDRAVIALADQRNHDAVARGHRPHPLQQVLFRQGRPAEPGVLPD